MLFIRLVFCLLCQMRYCVLLISLLNIWVVEAQTMPSYSTALKKIYKEYNTENMPPFRLMKKRDGWWIAELDYSTGTSVMTNATLYWSKKSGLYSALKYPKRKIPLKTQEELDAYDYRAPDKYNYERCSYFGYDAWSSDVIQDFGNRQILSNVELESLSRAYSTYAMEFTSRGQWGYVANPSGPGRNVNEVGRISKSQVDSFIKYAELELRTIQKLIAKDPNYPVIVGHIRNKLANEYMHIYHQLHMAGYPELAETYLQKAAYDPTCLSMARNYLSGLPENAILISNGDNDTYPVWYVQQKQGFRKDVAVLNYSLLPLPMYQELIHKPGSPFGYVEMHHRFGKPEGKNFIYDRLIRVIPNEETVILSADSLLNYFYSEQPENEYQIAANNVSINNRNFSIEREFKRPQYIFPSDIIFMDIYSSNDRPVCGTPALQSELESYSNTTLKGLNLYLENTGNPDHFSTDSAATADWYLNNFESPQADPLATYENDNFFRHGTGNDLQNISAAIAFTQAHGQKENMHKLTALGMHIFPDGKMHFNNDFGNFIMTLAEAGEHDSVRVLLKPFLKQAIKKEEQFRDWKKAHPDQTHDALWLFRSTEPVVASMLSRAEYLGLQSYAEEIRRALTLIRTIANQ